MSEMASQFKEPDPRTKGPHSAIQNTHQTCPKATNTQELSLGPISSAAVRYTPPRDDNIPHSTANLHTPKIKKMDLYYVTVLSVWRRRREQIGKCAKDIEDLKQNITESRQELRNTSKILQIMKEENDKLSLEIRKLKNIRDMDKSLCESNTTKILRLNAEKDLLRQELQQMITDIDNLNELINMNNSDMSVEQPKIHEVQAKFSSEQHRRYQLEEDIVGLNRGILDVKNVICEAKQKHNSECEAREEEKAQIVMKIEILSEEKIRKEINLQRDIIICQDLNETQTKLLKEKDDLKAELQALNQRLSKTFWCRLKTYWFNELEQRKDTIRMLHRITFYLLPAIPPPENVLFPFRTALLKAMTIFNI